MHNCMHACTLVQVLVAHAKSDVDAVDQWKYTPLHEAVAKGKSETVRILLINGASRTKKNCEPLHASLHQPPYSPFPLLHPHSPALSASSLRFPPPLTLPHVHCFRALPIDLPMSIQRNVSTLPVSFNLLSQLHRTSASLPGIHCTIRACHHRLANMPVAIYRSPRCPAVVGIGDGKVALDLVLDGCEDIRDMLQGEQASCHLPSQCDICSSVWHLHVCAQVAMLGCSVASGDSVCTRV